MSQPIGFTYNEAIGHSYSETLHASGMAKTRSFYDRAMEALRERYPGVKPTQERLAAIAGVKQPSVNEWKDGYPAMETTVRLAEGLKVCVEWLYTERGTKYPIESRETDPLLRALAQLDPQKREQLARFADFIKNEK